MLDDIVQSLLTDERARVVLDDLASSRALILDRLKLCLLVENVRVVCVASQGDTPLDLRCLMNQIAGPDRQDGMDRTERFYAALTRPEGNEKRLVVLVDDAHLLTDQALQCLDLFASTASTTPLPMQLVLAGASQLLDRLPSSGVLAAATLGGRFALTMMQDALVEPPLPAATQAPSPPSSPPSVVMPRPTRTAPGRLARVAAVLALAIVGSVVAIGFRGRPINHPAVTRTATVHDGDEANVSTGPATNDGAARPALATEVAATPAVTAAALTTTALPLPAESEAQAPSGQAIIPAVQVVSPEGGPSLDVRTAAVPESPKFTSNLELDSAKVSDRRPPVTDERPPPTVPPVDAVTPINTVDTVAASDTITSQGPAAASTDPATVLPPPGTNQESPSVVEVLLARGAALLATGDVTAARLTYERAAASNAGAAAIALGMTYDPRFLAEIRAAGIEADPQRALTWYRRAADLGSAAEAAPLLTQLEAASEH